MNANKNQIFNNIPKDELRVITKAAWLYYMQRMTQNEIAQELNCSRVKITRLISRAKSMGIVDINIIQPPGLFVDLEQALISRYNLKDTVITMDVGTGEPLREILARAAADWLLPQLHSELVVGFSLGRTLAKIPEFMQPLEKSGVNFIEVMGASDSLTSGFNSYRVIGRMAEACGGQARLLDVPTFVSNQSIRNMLLKEERIAKRFSMARNCEILLTSVGTVDKEALLYQIGYLNDEIIDQLNQDNAIGDLLGQYFDANGNPIPNPLNDRVMALKLQDLKKIPYSVLISGGKDKHQAIKAAITGKFVNVLITDISTAKTLLV